MGSNSSYRPGKRERARMSANELRTHMQTERKRRQSARLTREELRDQVARFRAKGGEVDALPSEEPSRRRNPAR